MILSAANLFTWLEEDKKKERVETAGTNCRLGSDLNSQRALAASIDTISELLCKALSK